MENPSDYRNLEIYWNNTPDMFNLERNGKFLRYF